MRRLVCFALVFAALACGGDDTTTPTQASVAGTWTLQTINGSPLPFTLATSPAKIELLSSVVNVTANGTWTSTTTNRTTFNGQATTTTSTDAGTYTLSGNNVAILSNTAGSTAQAGAVNGNTLTLSQQGFVFVYTKQ
jgi:lipocalin-like protein